MIKRDWILIPAPIPSHERRVAEYCRHLQVKREVLLSPRRSRHLAWPRQDLMLTLHLDGMSFSKIGRFMSRHHTTIMHGVRQAAARQRRLTSSQAVQKAVGRMTDALQGRHVGQYLVDASIKEGSV